MFNEDWIKENGILLRTRCCSFDVEESRIVYDANFFFGFSLSHHTHQKKNCSKSSHAVHKFEYVQGLLKNEIFEKGNDTKSNHAIAKQQEWWKVDELTERIDRKMELPKAEYLECTVGLEDGKTYVYVTWFEI